MDTIRAGLIGGGMMGNAHAAALRRLGFIDVVAIAERDMDTAKKAQEMITIPKAYGDYRELLEDKDVDVFSRLRVSQSCPVILPYHVALDVAREKARGRQAIGT